MNMLPDSPRRPLRRFAIYIAISASLNLAVWVLLLLPRYLANLGWGPEPIGWTVSVYFFTNLFAQLLFGALVQKWGVRRIAIVGSAAGTVGGILYMLVPLWLPALWIARALHGVGTGLVFVAAFTQLIQTEPRHLRGKAIGYFGVPGFLMMGLGPSLADWLVLSYGYLTVFAVVFLCFAPLLLWYGLRQEQREAPPETSHRLGWKITLKQDGLMRVLVLAVFFGFSFSCWMTFLAPALAHLPGAIGVFGIGYAAGALVSRFTLTGQFANSARRWLAVGALVLYGAATGAIPWAASLSQVAILACVAGLIHGTYYPALSVVAAERFHPQWQGQGLALYAASQTLGLFLGPPAWGLVSGLAGLKPAFLLAGGILIVSTIFFLVREIFFRPSDASQPEPKSPRYQLTAPR
ncbi:MAG: MFS transporter [Acidobacteriota bacterium]